MEIKQLRQKIHEAKNLQQSLELYLECLEDIAQDDQTIDFTNKVIKSYDNLALVLDDLYNSIK